MAKYLKYRIIRVFFSSIFIFFFPISLFSQTDSSAARIEIKGDSVITKTQSEHSPRKAALYSLILPGLGQAYNKKYWKIPIIYGGGAVLGYYIYINNNLYLDFKDSYNAKINMTGADPYPRASLDVVKLNRDFSKRNRDFLIILSVMLYGLNIVDAVVDAHLKSFDLSDNLGMSIEPSFNQIYQQPIAGLTVKLHLK